MARYLSTVLLLITGGGAVLTGCSDPCSNLSKAVCDCFPTQIEQQRCYQRVDLEAEVSPATEEEQQRCQEILDADTCSCEALDAGELSACGLSR